MSKKVMSIVFVIFFLSLFTVQLVEGDRLLLQNRNYFLLEKDSIAGGDTIIDTVKFFPFGWWYDFEGEDKELVGEDSVYKHPEIDSILADSGKINTLMPTFGSREIFDEMKYGAEKGFYIFACPPREVFRQICSRINIFRDDFKPTCDTSECGAECDSCIIIPDNFIYNCDYTLAEHGFFKSFCLRTLDTNTSDTFIAGWDTIIEFDTSCSSILDTFYVLWDTIPNPFDFSTIDTILSNCDTSCDCESLYLVEYSSDTFIITDTYVHFTIKDTDNLRFIGYHFPYYDYGYPPPDDVERLYTPHVTYNEVGSGALHVTSLDTNFTIHFYPKRSRFRWYFDDLNYKFDWLSFRIASFTDFGTGDTFRLIAKYIAHNTVTSEKDTFFVELNSISPLYITEGYDNATSTITVSLQNPNFFSDDTLTPSFPLYGRNPNTVINLYDPTHPWFTVFAQMDSIIHHFTKEALDTGYVLDELLKFELVGTHYMIDNLAYHLNDSIIANMESTFTDSIVNSDSLYDKVLTWMYWDEPHLFGRDGYTWQKEDWDTKTGLMDILDTMKTEIKKVDSSERPKPFSLKLSEGWVYKNEGRERFKKMFNQFTLDSLFDFSNTECYPGKMEPDNFPINPDPNLHYNRLFADIIRLSLDSAGASLDSIGKSNVPFVFTAEAVSEAGACNATRYPCKDRHCHELDTIPEAINEVSCYEELVYNLFCPIVHGARGILWWNIGKTMDSLNSVHNIHWGCNDSVAENVHKLSKYFFNGGIDQIIMSDSILDDYVTCSESSFTHPDYSFMYNKRDINWIFRRYDADSVVAGDEYYMIVVNDINAKWVHDSFAPGDLDSNYYDSESLYCYENVVFTLDSLDSAY
ncbi:hypothetical protein JXI42_06450 [bacterium]|nr:hypothetical protein [bacterium]